MPCNISEARFSTLSFQDFSDSAGVFVELTFVQQSTAFLYSLLLGLALGAFYEAVKIVRLSFNLGRAGTVASDILFMLASSVAVFLFSLGFLLGFVRTHVVIGCFLGFSAFKLSVGRLMAKIYYPIILFIRKISYNIRSKIKKIAKKLLKNIYNIMYNIINRRGISKNAKSNAERKRVMSKNEGKECSVKKSKNSSKARKRINERN